MSIIFIESVIVFVVLILIMCIVIYLARRFILPQGSIEINLNDGRKKIQTPIGGKLLFALADNNIFLSSGCGGKGTCGQDKCQVSSGGGSILPIEENFFNLSEIRENWRLACQVTLHAPMSVTIDENLLGAKEWVGTVLSNENVATFIKDLTIQMDEDVHFTAGGFMQILVPPYKDIKYADFDVPKEYRKDWEHFKFFNITASNPKEETRAYSMASYPLEKNLVKFNIRIATPPPNKPDIPAGIASSYVFSLKKGDKIKLRGPYGEFAVREDSDKEMIFIGGGAGMAPLRSEIFDQLLRVKTKRKMSYWYGARSKKEMFYVEDFEKLAQDHKNFTWHVALSDPSPEDHWKGDVGYIHNILKDEYLSKMEAPEDCEYYLCGPPPMLKAVLELLDNFGVSKHDILFDDFGS